MRSIVELYSPTLIYMYLFFLPLKESVRLSDQCAAGVFSHHLPHLFPKPL